MWTLLFGWIPQDDEPIKLNSAIFTLCNVLKWVVASAAEAEVGALFLNCKEGKVIRTILEEMGHEQPVTPVYCDNATAVGIANKTIKRLRSKSMEMRFFWIIDQAKWGRKTDSMASRLRKSWILSIEAPC